MSNVLARIVVFAACTVTAAAQSFNVDICEPSLRTPSSDYGAAARQPGFWNCFQTTSPDTPPTALLDLAGAPTTVTLGIARSVLQFWNDGNLAGAAPDDLALFADACEPQEWPPTPAPEMVLTISGLGAGTYSVFTYAFAPDVPMLSDVVVERSTDPLRIVGGSYPGAGTFVLGITHAEHRIEVSPGDSIVIGVSRTASAPPTDNWATVNGLQVVRWNNGATFCAGDGLDASHTTPCPCRNDGAPGHGCANSVNASGALLEATGHTGFDDVALVASGMPHGVMSIFLQGDALADAVFGDGVRCIGGNLLRLRARTTSGGTSRFPDASDTLTLSQRAEIPIGLGVVRHYQVYHRNAAVTFCPSGASNVTNGRTITW